MRDVYLSILDLIDMAEEMQSQQMPSELAQILALLRDEVAIARDEAAIPKEARLWSKQKVAMYFGVSESTVDRAIVSRRDFPDAMRIPGGPLRWHAEEVMEWAASKKKKRAACTK